MTLLRRGGGKDSRAGLACKPLWHCRAVRLAGQPSAPCRPALLAEEQPIRGFPCFLDPRIAQLIEEGAEFGVVLRRHLDADQHAAVVGAVVAVVEQADVPVEVHG